jgi:hypothetical protein
MDWRDAFFVQAQSDYRVLKVLNQRRLEACHQLHYLQMTAEKLAKGFLARPGDTQPPPTVHSAFVRMLQVLKGRPDVRRRLGYARADVFTAYIDSLLPLAHKIERLAPALAGLRQPNPEYPWQSRPEAPVIAPARFGFPDFMPTSVLMARLFNLLSSLLDIVTPRGLPV